MRSSINEQEQHKPSCYTDGNRPPLITRKRTGLVREGIVHAWNFFVQGLAQRLLSHASLEFQRTIFGNDLANSVVGRVAERTCKPHDNISQLAPFVQCTDSC